MLGLAWLSGALVASQRAPATEISVAGPAFDLVPAPPVAGPIELESVAPGDRQILPPVKARRLSLRDSLRGPLGLGIGGALIGDHEGAPGVWRRPWAVSADLRTVVGYEIRFPIPPDDPERRPNDLPASPSGLFRYSRASGLESVDVDLDIFEGILSIGDVDASGRMIVGSVSRPSGGSISTVSFAALDAMRASEAFVWRAGEDVQSFEVLLESMGVDLGGNRLATAISLSADGRVVMGRTTSGEHYRAVLPEAGPGLLITIGLAALARVGRDRAATRPRGATGARRDG